MSDLGLGGDLRQQRLEAKVDRSGGPDACHPWTGSTSHGYGMVTVNRRTFRAHRVAYELYVGPIPDGLLIRHTCDNPACCNPRHLLTGTDLDNKWDSIERGRHNFGKKNGSARLTDEQVLAIRAQYASGRYLLRELGAIYGVSRVHVGRIVHGKKWAHLRVAEVGVPGTEQR
jgi:HNH endonuclease